jgi:hypothetical protein
VPQLLHVQNGLDTPVLPRLLPNPNLGKVFSQDNQFRDELIAKDPEEITQFFDGKFKEAIALGKQTQAQSDATIDQQYVDSVGAIVWTYQWQSEDVRKKIENDLTQLGQNAASPGEKALVSAIKSVLDKDIGDFSKATDIHSFRTAEDEVKTGAIKSEIDAAIKTTDGTTKKVVDILAQYIDKALDARRREVRHYARNDEIGLMPMEKLVPVQKADGGLLFESRPLTMEEKQAQREAEQTRWEAEAKLPGPENYRDAIIRVLRNQTHDTKKEFLSRLQTTAVPFKKLVEEWHQEYPNEDMRGHRPTDPESNLSWINDFQYILEKTGQNR